MRAAGPAQAGASSKGSGHALAGCEAGVLDHRAGAGEATQVAGLGEDRSSYQTGERPLIEQASWVDYQVVEDGDHARFGVGQLGPGGVPVLNDPTDALKRTEPVRDHSGGVGHRGVEVAQDPQAGTDPPRRVSSLRTACSNRASPSLLVRVKSPPSRVMSTCIAASQVWDLNGCLAVVCRGRPRARADLPPLGAAALVGSCRGECGGARPDRPVEAGTHARISRDEGGVARPDPSG